MITKCELLNISFKCYLFGSAFGGGICPQMMGLSNLVFYLREFVVLVLGGSNVYI